MPKTSLNSVLNQEEIHMPTKAKLGKVIQLPNPYDASGVNNAKAEEVIENIKVSAKKTMAQRRGCVEEIGGFASVFDLKATGFQDPLLVSCTDGVGTKIQLALEHRMLHHVGQDLVAMCVNDLVTRGAEPLFFQDYLSTSTLDPSIATTLIDGIAQACLKSARKGHSCALVGGEIAEMPGFYQKHSWDLAGFVVGAVERDCLLPRQTYPDDVVIGLASSGLHANGFSLVRRILAETKPVMDQQFSQKHTLIQALLEPTRLYVRSVLAVLDACDGVRALAHITGGGLLTNLERVLSPETTAIVKKPSWDGIFSWVQKHGDLTDDDMLKVFNCGIGMVLVVAPDQADRIGGLLREEGEHPTVIGHLIKSYKGQKRATFG